MTASKSDQELPLEALPTDTPLSCCAKLSPSALLLTAAPPLLLLCMLAGLSAAAATEGPEAERPPASLSSAGAAASGDILRRPLLVRSPPGRCASAVLPSPAAPAPAATTAPPCPFASETAPGPAMVMLDSRCMLCCIELLAAPAAACAAKGLMGACDRDSPRLCCCCCCCQGADAAAICDWPAPKALRKEPSVPLPVLLCLAWREWRCRAAARIWYASRACLTVPRSALARPAAPVWMCVCMCV